MNLKEQILTLLDSIPNKRTMPSGIRYRGLKMPKAFFPQLIKDNFFQLTDCGTECEVYVNIESRVILDYYPEDGSMLFYHAFTIEHFQAQINKLNPNYQQNLKPVIHA